VTLDALPVCVIMGKANEHDSRKLIPLVEEMREKGRKPKKVYADKAYSTFIVRWYLGKRRISAQIPSRAIKRRPGRPIKMDEDAYKKRRSSVERFFSMLKGGFRRLAIRYERLATTFLAFVKIACFLIRWRVLK
jgi:IS5 family transposase